MSIIQNLTSSRPTVQVDGRIVSQNVDKQGTTTLNLENGERFTGKIIGMSDENGVKNVQIKLSDDVVISAKLNEQMPLKEGQMPSFEVRGFSQNQITLTPLYENTSIDPTALKALNAAGLEATADNVNMVKSMMENGMSIDKDSLNDMHQIISANQNTEPSTLVQMKALNIPINDQNITQFESYKNYQHQVVETMESIMDDLPEAYNELSGQGDIKAANDMYGDILKMLSEGAQQMGEKADLANAGTISQNLETASAASQNNGLEAVLEEAVPSEGKAAANPEEGAVKTLDANGNPVDVNGNAADKNAVDANGKPIDIQANIEAGANANGEAVTNAAQNQNPRATVLSNDFINLLKDIKTDTGLSGPEMTKLLSLPKDADNVQIDKEALLRELSNAYEKNGHVSEQAEKAFGKLFSSDGYNKLMKESMKDQWMLEPRDVSSKENVDSLYSRLNAQAKQLTETLTNSLGADSKVAQSATNLQNNIDFMNQLNNMFNYIQLPLKMADQDAHGDLYVYSNGKRKFEPGETVSAILHLDMDNLGPLDVYVKMRDNNVKTNFYVADEQIIDLIAEHIDILNERLNKRGYNMEAKMMLHTDLDNDSDDMAVSEMLDVKKMPIISMQSFDARA